jgi:hypothetical protein
VPLDEELIDLERRGWDALSSSGAAATAFYGEVLAARVLFLLPGSMVLDDRDAVLESLGGSPWTSYALTDQRALALGEDAAVVANPASAVREGGRYEALMASTYVREGGAWKLAVHQQTPV